MREQVAFALTPSSTFNCLPEEIRPSGTRTTASRAGVGTGPDEASVERHERARKSSSSETQRRRGSCFSHANPPSSLPIIRLVRCDSRCTSIENGFAMVVEATMRFSTK